MQLLFGLIFTSSKVFDAQLTWVHAAKSVAEKTRCNSQAGVFSELKNIDHSWQMIARLVILIGGQWSSLSKYFM